jgi:hypothetical protein
MQETARRLSRAKHQLLSRMASNICFNDHLWRQPQPQLRHQYPHRR